MIIIWGSKWKKEIIETGFFKCPICQDVKEFEIQEAQKYFTFFFIPLFSYGKIITYLECIECNNTFNTNAFTITNSTNLAPEKE